MLICRKFTENFINFRVFRGCYSYTTTRGSAAPVIRVRRPPVPGASTGPGKGARVVSRHDKSTRYRHPVRTNTFISRGILRPGSLKTVFLHHHPQEFPRTPLAERFPAVRRRQRPQSLRLRNGHGPANARALPGRYPAGRWGLCGPRSARGAELADGSIRRR